MAATNLLAYCNFSWFPLCLLQCQYATCGFWLILLFSVLILLYMVWHQRKGWQVIWQLNGFRGIFQQIFIWLFWIAFIEPKYVLRRIEICRRFLRCPFAFFVGHKFFLYVDDPWTLEKIYNATECVDKTTLQNGFFARKGLLHAKGEKWRIRRKQLNPCFNHSILTSFFDTFNNVGNQMIEEFLNAVRKCSDDNSGGTLNFHQVDDLLCRTVLKVSCQTTMGIAINFTRDDPQNIPSKYKRLMDISAMKIFKPWLQFDFICRWLAPNSYKSGIECNKIVSEFVQQIVERKYKEWLRNRNVESSSLGNQKRIFIEQIFNLAASGDMTLEDIIDESQSMVMVSFETVSNSVVLTLLLLAMHQHYQENLRNEINDIFPINDNTTKTNNISYADLQQMTYLDMLVNESLRLLTTVPLNMRYVSKDFQLQLYNVHRKGYFATLPKGTNIIINTFQLHRDNNQWGPRASEYQPEHFSKENMPNHPFAFSPFSRGLRTCIGWRYSIYLMKILLIKLVSHFEFHTLTKLEQLDYIAGITVKLHNNESILFDIQEVYNEKERKEEEKAVTDFNISN